MRKLLVTVMKKPETRNQKSVNCGFVKRSLLGMVVTMLLFCLATKPASAAVIYIDMIENAGFISVTMSGSLDFTSNGVDATGAFSNFIAPANGTMGLGLSSTLIQVWRTPSSTLRIVSTDPVQTQQTALFSPFGGGGYAESAISGFSGDNLFLYTNAFGVARDYVSGAPLSATGTISGTFASNGITVGTSTTVFELGAFGSATENTLIVSRSIAGVPEPSTGALGLVGLIAIVLRRRKTA